MLPLNNERMIECHNFPKGQQPSVEPDITNHDMLKRDNEVRETIIRDTKDPIIPPTPFINKNITPTDIND